MSDSHFTGKEDIGGNPSFDIADGSDGDENTESACLRGNVP